MTSASTMPLMPPRIMQYPFIRRSVTRPDVFRCWDQTRHPRPFGALGQHPRWTGLLLMAELSVGHARYGEPRWARDTWDQAWRLMWPCRRCGNAPVSNPAAHTAGHLEAARLRLARLQSFGPLRDA